MKEENIREERESQKERPARCKWRCLNWDGEKNGLRCRLKARGDYCLLHAVGGPGRGIIDSKIVTKFVSDLPEDDPWKKASVVEITQRSQGFYPTMRDFKGKTYMLWVGR